MVELPCITHRWRNEVSLMGFAVENICPMKIHQCRCHCNTNVCVHKHSPPVEGSCSPTAPPSLDLGRTRDKACWFFSGHVASRCCGIPAQLDLNRAHLALQSVSYASFWPGVQKTRHRPSPSRPPDCLCLQPHSGAASSGARWQGPAHH